MNNEINLATLFATYWGVEYRYTFFDDEVTNIMNEIVDEWCLTKISNDYYKDFYLKLTPLTSISDEDAIEVAKMYAPAYPHHHTAMVGKAILSKFFVDNIDIIDFNSGKAQYVIDYLRSKGYDCGYMHITSLIESGYAIDKTKLI